MNDYMLDAANEMRHEAAVERLVEEHGPDREFTRDEIEDAALQLDAEWAAKWAGFRALEISSDLIKPE